jgi:hypothetical protein
MDVGTRSRGVWWLIVAAVFAGLLALDAAGFVYIVVRGPRERLVLAPFTALAAYWFMMGAWRRTSWGRPEPGGAGPPGPPGLSPQRARALILLAVACAAAVVTAFIVQIVLAHST